MADTGWDISMRRIDFEYDLPQFVASALVRKIAAHSFRLPAMERERFQKIPGHVIERIEQIVRVAYLEAGEAGEAGKSWEATFCRSIFCSKPVLLAAK